MKIPQPIFGNVCLAAHNRGYPVNYFQDLKTLRQEDEIYYYTQEGRKCYLVEEMKIIEETDVRCLENTEENRLTLITCVENEPNYRRCVIGKEKEEKIEE